MNNNNNPFLKKTIVLVTIPLTLMTFGWFYYFLDIDSLLPKTSDLIDNRAEANTDDPSALWGKDGEDGKVGISIGDGHSTADASGGDGGNGGIGGGTGGDGGTAMTFGSPGSTADASGGDGGNGGVAINMPG